MEVWVPAGACVPGEAVDETPSVLEAAGATEESGFCDVLWVVSVVGDCCGEGASGNSNDAVTRPSCDSKTGVETSD